jgi:hypothetical protein
MRRGGYWAGKKAEDPRTVGAARWPGEAEPRSPGRLTGYWSVVLRLLGSSEIKCPKQPPVRPAPLPVRSGRRLGRRTDATRAPSGAGRCPANRTLPSSRTRMGFTAAETAVKASPVPGEPGPFSRFRDSSRAGSSRISVRDDHRANPASLPSHPSTAPFAELNAAPQSSIESDPGSGFRSVDDRSRRHSVVTSGGAG